MNKKLKFSPEFVPLILSNKKANTWRLFDDKDLTEGDILDFINSETLEHFTTAKITRLTEKPLGKLTDEDQVGHKKYTDINKLCEDFQNLYKRPVTPETLVKIILFDIVARRG